MYACVCVCVCQDICQWCQWFSFAILVGVRQSPVMVLYFVAEISLWTLEYDVTLDPFRPGPEGISEWVDSLYLELNSVSRLVLSAREGKQRIAEALGVGLFWHLNDFFCSEGGKATFSRKLLIKSGAFCIFRMGRVWRYFLAGGSSGGGSWFHSTTEECRPLCGSARGCSHSRFHFSSSVWLFVSTCAC